MSRHGHSMEAVHTRHLPLIPANRPGPVPRTPPDLDTATRTRQVRRQRRQSPMTGGCGARRSGDATRDHESLQHATHLSPDPFAGANISCPEQERLAFHGDGIGATALLVGHAGITLAAGAWQRAAELRKALEKAVRADGAANCAWSGKHTGE